MAHPGEYLGMPLHIDDVDGENLAYFRYCAEGEFRLQRGGQVGPAALPAHHRLPVDAGTATTTG